MKRPKCPRCRGLLMPDYVPGILRVVRVKCVICGHNINREFVTRKPTASEKNVELKKGRPCGARG